MSALFGTDGVRGIANVELTVELAMALGAASSQVIETSNHFIIGMDTRRSCSLLESAFIAGVLSQGRDVVAVGVIPTPGVSFLTKHTLAAAGVMISASHNPAPDNGIKFFGPDGKKLSTVVEAEISQAVATWHQVPRGSGKRIGRLSVNPALTEAYLDSLVASMQGERLTDIKIVLDCAHGAASYLAPKLFRLLGADVIPIGNEPDGDNINTGCGSTSPQALCKAVLETQSDLGITFDGDADRVLLCDSLGRIVTGDHQLLMNAELALFHEKRKITTVVGTVMSNMGLAERLRTIGLTLDRAAVGDRNVAEHMQKVDADIGGEPSGHILLHRLSPAGDGMLAALQCLRILHKTSTRLTHWVDEIKMYPQLIVSVPLGDKVAWQVEPTVITAIETAEDALRDCGRILVRASGTEPSVRVMVEAKTTALVNHWVHTVANAIRRVATP